MQKKVYHNGRIEITEKIDAKWAKHLDHVLHSKEPYLNYTIFYYSCLNLFCYLGFISTLFLQTFNQTR